MNQGMNQMETMAGRRRHERLRKELTVRYCRLEHFGESGPDHRGELLDIGAGGLCFRAEDAIELGSQLVLVLAFPGWLAADDQWTATTNDDDVGTLHVVGMVVWVAAGRGPAAGYQIGIRFSGIIRK